MHSDAADRTGLDRIDGQRAAVEAPPVRCAQILVVVAQVPHHIGCRLSGDRPVVGDAGDAPQRIAGLLPGGVDLTDDGMLGPGHVGQRRHRGADPVAPVMAPHRVQRPRRIGKA